MRPRLAPLLFASVLPLAGCSETLLGHFTVLSTRTYDVSQPYVMLGRFKGGSHPAFGGGTLEEAVQSVLDQVPGGQYLANVMIKRGGFPDGYDVEGDVWGLAPASPPPAR